MIAASFEQLICLTMIALGGVIMFALGVAFAIASADFRQWLYERMSAPLGSGGHEGHEKQPREY